MRLVPNAFSHFDLQVAENAISFWYHDHILTQIEENYPVIMTIVFPALYGISKIHWNPAIVTLVKDVLQTFMERYPLLFDELASSYNRERH